jgi:hypothetical protein
LNEACGAERLCIICILAAEEIERLTALARELGAYPSVLEPTEATPPRDAWYEKVAVVRVLDDAVVGVLERRTKVRTRGVTG